MHAIQPDSHVASMPPTANDRSCSSCTTKIALAIIATLAAYVFLPIPAAIAFSAVVILAVAICCVQGSSLPVQRMPIAPNEAEPLRAAPQEKRPAESVLAPSTVCVVPQVVDPLQALTHIAPLQIGDAWTGTMLTFTTPEAGAAFLQAHQHRFKDLATVSQDEQDGKNVKLSYSFGQLDQNEDEASMSAKTNITKQISAIIREIFGQDRMIAAMGVSWTTKK